jgi:uncharacterized membrane protein
MHSQMHYLPLAPGFFAILVGFLLIVLILRSVRYAYESLGVSSNTAILLLFATLIGSIFNIAIAELPPLWEIHGGGTRRNRFREIH